MSVDTVVKFFKEMSADAEAVESLKASMAKGADAFVAYAKEKGFDLSADDLKEFSAKLEEKRGELSENELDTVSGGAAIYGNCDILTFTVDSWKKMII